jgi:hypothetical protein
VGLRAARQPRQAEVVRHAAQRQARGGGNRLVAGRLVALRLQRQQ